MKYFIVMWLLAAGVGVSYSIVTERQRKVRLLKEMERSLKQLAYYMYQWRMPLKEAIVHVVKEEKGTLSTFYTKLSDILMERQVEDFGILWQEQCCSLWQEEGCEILRIWSEAFINLPMEPEAMNRRLLLRAKEIEDRRCVIEEKYKGEQKLVFTMGFFVSAFFCLILW